MGHSCVLGVQNREIGVLYKGEGAFRPYDTCPGVRRRGKDPLLLWWQPVLMAVTTPGGADRRGVSALHYGDYDD